MDHQIKKKLYEYAQDQRCRCLTKVINTKQPKKKKSMPIFHLLSEKLMSLSLSLANVPPASDHSLPSKTLKPCIAKINALTPDHLPKEYAMTNEM